jgi:hypothetical protein
MDQRCGFRAGSCVPQVWNFWLPAHVLKSECVLRRTAPTNQTDTEDLRTTMAKKDGAIEVEGRVV